jgi:hypothetical protein
VTLFVACYCRHYGLLARKPLKLLLRYFRRPFCFPIPADGWPLLCLFAAVFCTDSSSPPHCSTQEKNQQFTRSFNTDIKRLEKQKKDEQQRKLALENRTMNRIRKEQDDEKAKNLKVQTCPCVYHFLWNLHRCLYCGGYVCIHTCMHNCAMHLFFPLILCLCALLYIFMFVCGYL